jgi:hypothetical protein
MTNITNKSGTQSIGYHGEVTTTILKNNKAIKVYKDHNEGTLNFFTGLCELVLGKQTTRIPQCAALYSFSPKVSNTTQYYSYSWDTLCEAIVETDATALQRTPVLVRVSQLADANVKQLSGTDNAPRADFQFVFPYDMISSSSAYNEEIYYFVLFPRVSATGEELTAKDALAVYKLSNAAGWSPISVNSSKSDYKLLIDWQLDFSNKVNEQ